MAWRGAAPARYALCLALAGCSVAPREPAPVERLASHLSGSFTSRAQAQADKTYFEIELRVARIWPDRADGPWLYVEQAAAATRDRPYRQRIYRLQAAGDGFVSWVYTLPGDPLAYAGAAARPERLAALQPAQLSLREGCEVQLRAEGTRFVGSTLGQGCKSDLRGATWASSEVVLDAQGMSSWDRGFDAAGRQVWGATAGGYRFDRVAAP